MSLSPPKLAAVVLIALGSTSAYCQSSGAASPLRTNTALGEVLVMPAGDAATPGITQLNELRVEIAIEDGFRVYRAFHRGRLHTAYAALDGPSRRFAFDLQRQRFREVEPTLILRLTDYDMLDAIIESTGAVGGKVYPALGWALLLLPPEANPAEVARQLASNPFVTEAEVQLKERPNVPM